MRYSELKHGDFIKPPRKYQWGRNTVQVDSVKPDRIYVIDTCDIGVGMIDKADYRPSHFIRHATDYEIAELDKIIKDNFEA